jgi:hypothetical protein
VQLTGAICNARARGNAQPAAPAVHCPGLWLVMREIRAASGEPISEGVRARVARIADELCTRLQLN